MNDMDLDELGLVRGERPGSQWSFHAPHHQLRFADMSRFSDEQAPKKHGVSEGTLYIWRKITRSAAVLAQFAIANCAQEHGAPMPGENVEEAGASRETDPSDAGAPARLDAAEGEEVAPPAVLSPDCGAAGPPLSVPDRFARRERTCLHSNALIDPQGRVHRPIEAGADATLANCPFPDELDWPGGGETCWTEPVCNVVEARQSDAGDGLACCYDLQWICGV